MQHKMLVSKPLIGLGAVCARTLGLRTCGNRCFSQADPAQAEPVWKSLLKTETNVMKLGLRLYVRETRDLLFVTRNFSRLDPSTWKRMEMETRAIPAGQVETSSALANDQESTRKREKPAGHSDVATVQVSDPRIALSTTRHARWLRMVRSDVLMGLPAVFTIAVVPLGVFLFVGATKYAPQLLPSSFTAARLFQDPVLQARRLAASALRRSLISELRRSQDNHRATAANLSLTNASYICSLQATDLIELAQAVTTLTGGTCNIKHQPKPQGSFSTGDDDETGPPTAAALRKIRASLRSRFEAIRLNWSGAMNKATAAIDTTELSNSLGNFIRVMETGADDSGFFETALQDLKTQLLTFFEHLQFEDHLLRREMDARPFSLDGSGPFLLSIPRQEERVALVRQRLPLLELLRWLQKRLGERQAASSSSRGPAGDAQRASPPSFDAAEVPDSYDFVLDMKGYDSLLQLWLGVTAQTRTMDAPIPVGATAGAAAAGESGGAPSSCRYPSSSYVSSMGAAFLMHSAVKMSRPR